MSYTAKGVTLTLAKELTPKTVYWEGVGMARNRPLSFAAWIRPPEEAYHSNRCYRQRRFRLGSGQLTGGRGGTTERGPAGRALPVSSCFNRESNNVSSTLVFTD